MMYKLPSSPFSPECHLVLSRLISDDGAATLQLLASTSTPLHRPLPSDYQGLVVTTLSIITLLVIATLAVGIHTVSK